MRSDENLLKFGTDPSLKRKIGNRDWERVELLFTLFRASGVRCRHYEDVAPMLKEKFIMLSPSAASTAYYDMPIGEVLKNHQDTVRELIAELAQLYLAMGNQNELFIEEEAFAAIDKMPKAATTSMHSDIEAGHTSELETLVGFVVKQAKKLKVETPRYEELYQAIKERIVKK